MTKAKQNPLGGFSDAELEEEVRRRELKIGIILPSIVLQRDHEPPPVIPPLPVVRSHLAFTIRGPRGSYSSATFGYDIESSCWGRTQEDIVARAFELDALVTKMCRERMDPSYEELKAAIKAAEEKWGE